MSNALNFTYLYFDIRNFANTNTLSTWTFKETPLTFIPDYTTSTLLSGARSVSNKILRWDFGDGTFSNDLTASHWYQWPGQYKVTLTVFDQFGRGFQSLYVPVVKVHDFINFDYVFEDYGKFVYDVPASKIIDPLVILMRDSWQNYHLLSAEGYSFSLYASGAAGDYQNIDNFFNDKWSHLRLLSRFLTKQKIGDTEQYVQTETLTANIEKIYTRINNNKEFEICSEFDDNSIFAGVTGRGEFWYVDDRTKNFTSRENPIFIFATIKNRLFKDKLSQYQNLYNYINTPPHGFQSLRPAVQPIIKVRHNPAAQLSFSTTGIDGEGTLSASRFFIPNISWQYTEVPFVIRFKDFENFTTKTYPPLYSSQIENTALSEFYDLKIGIISHDTYPPKPISDVAFYSDFNQEIPQETGGFYKGYFISNESALNCTLTASVLVKDPVNFPKDTIIGYISIPQYSFVLRLFREQKFSGCSGTVSMTLTANTDFRPVNAERNILAITVAPSGAGKGRDYRSWLADSVRDSIIHFDTTGSILNTYRLSACPTLANNDIIFKDYRINVAGECVASPSNMTLDGEGNLWCALFDTGSIIKIDTELECVTHTFNLNQTNIIYWLSSFGAVPFLSGFAGEGLFLPASIDADIANNVWAAYTHPVSNFLVQYDTYGQLMTTIPLPYCISPVELCIDRDTNIWLTALNLNTSGTSLTGRNDYLYKFDKFGNIINGYPLTGFRHIGPITVDGGQNAWVAHDRHTVSRIDADTGIRTDYIAGSAEGIDVNTTNYIGSIVGITCDTSDYIWAVNDWDKKIYIFDTLNWSITGLDNISEINLAYPNILPQYPLSAFELTQFQAYGDWFGFRWINKYMVPFSITRTITGESSVFNLYPAEGQNNIAKINENFDLANFYKVSRYQEILLDNQLFFNDFLGTIVGDISSKPYELGKVLYERISNYVDNKCDIDKCGLDTLLGFCDEFKTVFENYNYPFPPQLRRVVDMLSIKHKQLWGDVNQWNENFANKFTTPANDRFGLNLGPEISLYTGVITSGKPIVAYELFSEQYSIINDKNIAYYTLTSVLPLSTYTGEWGWNLVIPPSISGVDVNAYYKFYEFIPTPTGELYNSVINWKDPQTTLSPQHSSYQTWVKDDGIMQTLISYELSKGLRLFTSAANIVYNN